MLHFWKSTPSEVSGTPVTSKKGVMSDIPTEATGGAKSPSTSDSNPKQIDAAADSTQLDAKEDPSTAEKKSSEDSNSISSVQQQPTKADPEMQTPEQPTVANTSKPSDEGIDEIKSDSQPFPSLNANAEDNLSSNAGISDQRGRRTSFRSFGFFYGRNKSTTKSAKKVEHSGQTSVIPTKGESKLSQLKKPHVSKEEQRATSYAYYVRSLIVGLPLPSVSLPATSKPSFMSRKKQPPQPMKKIKSELLIPDEANRVIAQLRTLPTPDTSKGIIHGTIRGKDGKLEERDIDLIPRGVSPIHAVCLDCTDDEADTYHFSQLSSRPIGNTSFASSASARSAGDAEPKSSDEDDSPPNLASADITSVIPVLRDLRIINLIAGPAGDFGLGQPAGSPGIFAGSVPSSAALADGMIQVGQQLLNLGFATSSAVLPSHTGIHPPLDRLSVLTYWWGYEVVMPPPSMKYLANVKSISNSLLNFLTAFSLFNSGVREILPFIRYASQFIDYEWNAIKAMDKGQGVVCAATWVMPAALVPRSWDFDDTPVDSSKKKSFAGLAFGGLMSSPTPLPPSLPGTEVIIQPIQPSINGPDAPLIPVVTVTPPMAALAIDEVDGPSSDK